MENYSHAQITEVELFTTLVAFEKFHQMKKVFFLSEVDKEEAEYFIPKNGNQNGGREKRG